MAFPTAVNSQITDSLQDGTENTHSHLPAKILQLSGAFARALEMENEVYQNQVNGIINTVLYALQKIGEITGDTSAAEATKTKLQEMADNLKAQITNGITAGAEITAALPSTNVNEQTLEAAAVHSLSISFQNAVNAQQQMYITMQAATTMAISTMLSLDKA